MTENKIIDPKSRPYRLGVALSGGGARGFAHVGALRAIEEAGLKPDIIAGVSAGSIVAVLYAAGVSFDRMLEIFTDKHFKDFCGWSVGKGAIFHLKPFKKVIQKELGDKINFEDLRMPTYVGVTDFDNGVPVEFHSGPILDPMIASCSIPIVFLPVKINGTSYVDGGVLRNHPAWIIRDMCENLIGVNCSPMLNVSKTHNSVLENALRTYNLMAKSNQRADMEMCDLSVETQELAHYKVFNLKEIRHVYLSGYARTRKMLKEKGWYNPTK